MSDDQTFSDPELGVALRIIKEWKQPTIAEEVAQQRRFELSMQFLEEKATGYIPADMSWAVWCQARGVYRIQG